MVQLGILLTTLRACTVLSQAKKTISIWNQHVLPSGQPSTINPGASDPHLDSVPPRSGSLPIATNGFVLTIGEYAVWLFRDLFLFVVDGGHRYRAAKDSAAGNWVSRSNYVHNLLANFNATLHTKGDLLGYYLLENNARQRFPLITGLSGRTGTKDAFDSGDPLQSHVVWSRLEVVSSGAEEILYRWRNRFGGKMLKESVGLIEWINLSPTVESEFLGPIRMLKEDLMWSSQARFVYRDSSAEHGRWKMHSCRKEREPHTRIRSASAGPNYEMPATLSDVCLYQREPVDRRAEACTVFAEQVSTPAPLIH